MPLKNQETTLCLPKHLPSPMRQKLLFCDYYRIMNLLKFHQRPYKMKMQFIAQRKRMSLSSHVKWQERRQRIKCNLAYLQSGRDDSSFDRDDNPLINKVSSGEYVESIESVVRRQQYEIESLERENEGLKNTLRELSMMDRRTSTL